jgi:hypothetical protein
MITAIEAVYRLYAFKLYSMSPPKLQMRVHLEGMHMVAYKSTNNLNDVVHSEKSQRSMLTEYFKVNSSNLAARNITIGSFLSTSFGTSQKSSGSLGKLKGFRLAGWFMQILLKVRSTTFGSC